VGRGVRPGKFKKKLNEREECFRMHSKELRRGNSTKRGVEGRLEASIGVVVYCKGKLYKVGKKRL